MSDNYKNISPEYQKYLCKHVREYCDIAYEDGLHKITGAPFVDGSAHLHFMAVRIGDHSDVDGERVCVPVPVATLHFSDSKTLLASFEDQADQEQFLDQLFNHGNYGWAEINKKLYVNMANINYITFEE